jgi:hypothetical protein
MRYVAVLFFASVLSVNAWGQVNLTTMGNAYTQDFDGLAASGTSNTWTDNSIIVGWYSNRIVYIGDAGTSTTGGIHSYGVAGTNPAADRALGALSSGSTSPVFAVRLVNSTGGIIKNLIISYRGEQWRQTANAQSLSFSYQVGATSDSTGTWTSYSGLDFTALQTGTAGALDGNATGNNLAIKDSITMVVSPGQEIWLRWSKTGTTSPGLAIDDFSVIPKSVDTPLPVTMKGITAKVETGKVRLNITTASESDIAGFNISRSISKEGPFQLISSYTSNTALRTSGSTTSGGSYSFVDAKVSGGKTYFYKVESVEKSGESKQAGEVLQVNVAVPKDFAVYQNYPNPFNPTTNIRFDLKSDASVTLEVYNALGSKVKSMRGGTMAAGTHEIPVDMSRMASGIYCYRFVAVDNTGKTFVQTQRMMLMK